MEELFLKYSDLIDIYFKNNASELYKMADKVLRNLKFHDVDKEEFYSLASEVFVVEALKNFDESQDFEGFLYVCLYNKFCSVMIRSRRKKRCTRIKVKIKDENGKVIEKEEIVPDVRMDAPVGNEEKSNFGDLIASNNCTEKEVIENGEYSEEMQKYLDKLSNLQRKVLGLNSVGFTKKEIIKKLNINQKIYEDCCSAIHSYRNTRDLM